ncbi:TPM domain-containing protein [Salinimicrobium gaetbulicola]|uniref:TPM domain-containing protein n=1 Tax=Salinimicrobium gaetbulicola TaxID=999702 RepID=A0ABW3IG23_9FLAO
MKIQKLIIGILILSLIACKDSKKSDGKIQPPAIEFDFSDMPENVEVKPDTYVNDLEKLFTKEQNEKLENYLTKLYSSTSKKIVVVTSPYSKELDKEWEIGTAFSNGGLWIVFSKSMKEVSIGADKKTDKIIPQEDREKVINEIIIPEFENGNFYKGIENGILELLKKWK